MAIHFFVYRMKDRPTVIPMAAAVAAGLGEALRDRNRDVRWHAAMALSHEYFGTRFLGNPEPPLPPDVGRFIEALCLAFGDFDEEIQELAGNTLSSIGPQLNRPPPACLIAALHSTNAKTRLLARVTVFGYSNPTRPATANPTAGPPK